MERLEQKRVAKSKVYYQRKKQLLVRPVLYIVTRLKIEMSIATKFPISSNCYYK